MRIVRLESLFLRPSSSYDRTVAQDEFDKALAEGNKHLGHWDNNVQWAVVPTAKEGAALIAAQLRQVFATKLDMLRLKPQDLQFTVLTMPVEAGLVWANARHLSSTVYACDLAA